jgi:pyridoxamine 5'-phosphate oxidase
MATMSHSGSPSGPVPGRDAAPLSAAAGLRRSYERGSLDDDMVASGWFEQFQTWFDVAVADPAVLEPNALQLATADAGGHPSVRTVLLKDMDANGIVFYTNYGSAKGRDLAVRPQASAVFVWLAHERQVRFSGPVAKISAEQTAVYFASRPRGSQLGAWASPQSEVVASRATLDALLAEITARFGDGPVPVPPHWGGYRLRPDSVEFWQGRRDRLHDRIRYRRTDDGWVTERLAP